jgi:peptidoglycan L-alanyl-D-glutamate endopeptidase CwlK
MTYKLGTASEEKLGTTHGDMQAVVRLAITLTDVDFSFVEGERSKEQQRANMNADPPVSWTMDSDHLPDENGDVKAGDIYPWFEGQTSLDPEHFKRVAKAMFAAAQILEIKIEWGGFWLDEKEDQPHWALI